MNTNRDIEDFFHHASHDLQAPLRKLSTFIERLLDKIPGGGSPEVLQYSSRIQATLTEMRSLVERMSLLGTLSPHPELAEKLDLTGIIEQAFSLVKLELGIDGELSCSVSMPVEGEKEQMSLLFRELLRNALQYSSPGKTPVIHIILRNLTKEESTLLGNTEPEGYHCIEITDNGRGFDPAISENLFKPFVRGVGKSEFPGQGLGLAICKKIVENHGGLIYGTALDTGSRFNLLLPAKQPQANAQ